MTQWHELVILKLFLRSFTVSKQVNILTVIGFRFLTVWEGQYTDMERQLGHVVYCINSWILICLFLHISISIYRKNRKISLSTYAYLHRYLYIYRYLKYLVVTKHIEMLEKWEKKRRVTLERLPLTKCGIILAGKLIIIS